MKIQNINSGLSFGKIPVMTCRIKDEKTKQANSATLYKLNTDNADDCRDVRYSNNTMAIRRSFNSAFIYGNNDCKEYYLLQNDKTGEVISCASTTHRFRRDDVENSGLSTRIEEFGVNNKYINAGEPMLAYIAKYAYERFDKSVYTLDTNIDVKNALKRAKFQETENEGITFLPQKRFQSFIDAAECRSQIDFEI